MLLSEKLFKRILGSYNSKNGSSEASFYHRKVSDEMKNELIGGQIAKSRVAKKTGDSWGVMLGDDLRCTTTDPGIATQDRASMLMTPAVYI